MIQLCSIANNLGALFHSTTTSHSSYSSVYYSVTKALGTRMIFLPTLFFAKQVFLPVFAFLESKYLKK